MERIIKSNTAIAFLLFLTSLQWCFDFITCLWLYIGYTPLTLAAAMAHKDMYNHLIEKEREVYWVYGDVTCAAYPLDNIDSIGKKGDINPTSALHLIIHGNKVMYIALGMFDRRSFQ